MIIKKVWVQVRDGGLPHEWYREGWYLFGFLPLYVRDMTGRDRRG